MKFDLHSNLAEQITIENLKWHYDAVTGDLDVGAYKHQEDIEYFAKLSAALKLVLDYFGIPEGAGAIEPVEHRSKDGD